MSLKEELFKMYQPQDDVAEIEKKCEEFFKKRLMAAANAKRPSAFIEVNDLPDILKRNMAKVRAWIHAQGLKSEVVEQYFMVISGWAPEQDELKPPYDVICYSWRSWF